MSKCSLESASRLEFLDYLEYKYSRMVRSSGIGYVDKMHSCGNAVDNENNLTNDNSASTSTGAAQVSSETSAHQNIEKLKEERDKALARVKELEQIVLKLKGGNKNTFQDDVRKESIEEFSQDVNIDLNGTNIRISIKVENNRNNRASTDFNRSFDDECNETENLLNLTLEEEDTIDMIELDDSVLDNFDS